MKKLVGKVTEKEKRDMLLCISLWLPFILTKFKKINPLSAVPLSLGRVADGAKVTTISLRKLCTPFSLLFPSPTPLPLPALVS